jgi:hypothetical protein
MKAKLIKEYEDYYLISDKEIESGDEYVKLDNRPRTLLLGTTISHVTKVSKLSKQNCDEIFGVVNVDVLATEHYKEYDNLPVVRYNSFTTGFNKAMELNKDKLFTLEDVRKAFNKGYLMKFNPSDEYTETLTGLVQSLQQPTEIDVEIEMEDDKDTLVDNVEQFLKDLGDKPKLDSEGCLVLTKKI